MLVHRGFVAGLLALGTAVASGMSAAPVWSEPGLLDPVYVFYPRGSCREERIELEIWDREAEQWGRHPRHPEVPVESCQLEDAGVLLQELRWRCIETRPVDVPATWVVGLDVFNPRVMERCAVDAPVAQGGLEIEITSPVPGTIVRGDVPRTALEGSVHIGGAKGARYDLVIALDVSQDTGPRQGTPDVFTAEVDAARSLIDQLRHRLGAVRIGIVTFPNLRMARNDPGGTGARREIALTDDPYALDRAIRAIRARGPGSFQSFSSGFPFAVAELLGENAGSGARDDARKVLVLAADGRSDVPFGPGAGELPRFVAKTRAAAEKAAAADVEMHFFALAGIAGDAPAFAQEAGASFRRVPEPRLGTTFLRLVSLPYVSDVKVTDLRTGKPLADLRLEADGAFRATLPVERGANRVLVEAVGSEGQRGQREVVVDFDDSLIQEALLAAERERIRKIRELQGRVEITPEESELRRP